MPRLNYLSFIVVCGGLGALLAGTAQSQGGVKNLLFVQPTTPGTQQSGHTNISGTSRAGQFVGGGAGLTGVNAAQLGGLAANQYGVVNNNNLWTGLNSFTNNGNSFTGNGAGLHTLNASNIVSGTLGADRLPNPLSLSGNVDNDAVIRGSNSSSSTFASGVIGVLSAAAPGAVSSAVLGQVLNGTQGIGVLGRHEGSGFGVYGLSNLGTGINGESASGVAISAGTIDGVGVNVFGNDGTAIIARSNKQVVQITKSTSSNETALNIDTSSNGGFGLRSVCSGASGTIAIAGESVGNNAIGVLGSSTGTGATYGLFGQSSSALGAGLRARNLGGGYAAVFENRTLIQDNLEITAGKSISVGAGSTPLFPIDFSEGLGDKISLWGTNPTSHFGFGIQGGQLQIFTSNSSDVISFGFGSSTNFTERARFTGTSELAFTPSSAFAASTISGPYDLVFSKDADNNSFDEWTRFFTNGATIEQARIQQNDEAAALFDGAVTANGIDFAEGFKVQDPTIEPGDLVINSGNNWEYISLSNQPYQVGVIGVVSTKPAFVAGMSFDAEDNIDPELTKRRDQARREKNEVLEKQLTKQMRELVLEKYRPVAFMGRVPVKVVGPVKVGDKLTASNVPGKAMAMSRSGHSIGIALEATAGKDGTIMAMIQPGYVSLETGSTIPELLTKITEIVAENVRLKDRVEELEARLERLERLVDSKLK